MHLQLRREMQLLLMELVLLRLALLLLLQLVLHRHLLLVLPLHLELVLLVLLLLQLLLLLHHLKLLLVMLSLLVMQLLLMVDRGRCRRMRQGCAARRSRDLFLDIGGLDVRPIPHQLVPALLDVLREVPDAAGEVLDGTPSALVPRAGVILIVVLGGLLPHHRRLRGTVDERVHAAQHRDRGPPAVAVTVAECRIGSSRSRSWDAGHRGGGHPSRPDSSNSNAGAALQRRRGAK
mmetsp:Transcript_102866/g.295229  ORF Transcript_102866/g.295229 Transcript_102866/m.295229 type:complete len:234 (+) Transcript_102866:448-1149(+)